MYTGRTGSGCGGTISADRRDPLYYIVPLGVSISLLARIYRSHISRSARRGLRTTGALLIYFATYDQVVQFDHGLPPLLLAASRWPASPWGSSSSSASCSCSASASWCST